MTTTPDEFAGLTREMLITQIRQLRDLVTMEQASLASAREEIAKLREESANAWTMDDVAEAQATERAAREAEAERDEARATKDMHKERQEEAWAEVTALRAEVEELKELIAPTDGRSFLQWRHALQNESVRLGEARAARKGQSR